MRLLLSREIAIAAEYVETTLALVLRDRTPLERQSPDVLHCFSNSRVLSYAKIRIDDIRETIVY